jgi:hypothetical protein
LEVWAEKKKRKRGVGGFQVRTKAALLTFFGFMLVSSPGFYPVKKIFILLMKNVVFYQR